jgi:hypothetical protein
VTGQEIAAIITAIGDRDRKERDVNDSPEAILLRMREMNAAVYSARWADDDDQAIGACVVVDGRENADRLIEFVKTLEQPAAASPELEQQFPRPSDPEYRGEDVPAEHPYNDPDLISYGEGT